MQKILLLNGPNLDRLGKRERALYGSTTLAGLEDRLHKKAAVLGVELHGFQSNHEGALIDKIAECADDGFFGAIINPGGFTHTSVALRDAIAGVDFLCIEVHISHIHRREDFRKHSFTAPVCQGVISGLGLDGYAYALEHLALEADRLASGSSSGLSTRDEGKGT